MSGMLIRLEKDRKMEKTSRKKNSRPAPVSMSESSFRVRRSNAFESTHLRLRLDDIGKEESSFRYDHKRSFDTVRKLQTTINQPVSRGVVLPRRPFTYSTDEEQQARRPRKVKSQGQMLYPLVSTSSLDAHTRNRRPRSLMELRRALSYESVTENSPAQIKRRPPRGPLVIVYR